MLIDDIKIANFSGPLDLLWQLLQVNNFDIKDIPIAKITEQYLTIIHRDIDNIDPELASEFLIMASTLMQLKSQILLPQLSDDEDEEDPREELTIKLLRYRRNKLIAEQLCNMYESNSGSYRRQPLSPSDLGIDIDVIEDKPSKNKFLDAVERLLRRNEERFSDRQQKLRRLLRRETFSVRDKIKFIADKLTKLKQFSFSDIFPRSKMPKGEIVAGFLAVLEMVKNQRIIAKQSKPFSEITVRRNNE